MKPTVILIVLILLRIPSSAQTLFTYGSHAVSKAEFLRAYNKNNTDSNGQKMSFSDYLSLYAKFRMKLQSAVDENLDTTQQQRSEVQGFRNQLAESYLKEEASIKLLTDEAASRSLKDIHLTDIYVPLKPEPTADEINAAEKKINEAYNKLKNGEPFDKVASQYNYADFGFITAFVVPYDIETIAYSTPPGKYSPPYRGAKAFHIFKPTEERKAIGTIRVAQILLAFPMNADENGKRRTQERADSAYNALKAGADFASLAARLSNDNLSYQTAGQLPVFGIGQYDPAFERAAFELQKDSDISKPVQTSFGYHIIKRIERIAVIEDVRNKQWHDILRTRVEQSDRMKVAQQALLKNIRDKIKNDAPAETQVSDTAALEYYREHLEKYNAEFAGKLKEFKEGNLLFNIMQKNVWDASSDSSALLKFYNDNKSRYWWENSADALIITCQNKKEIDRVRNLVKTDRTGWQKLSDANNGLVQADSGRFELSQIPVVERTNFTEGLMTAPVPGVQDSSATFAYIIKLYRNREPKKFEDARGAVINDYQEYLEDSWVAKLQKKYPLRINERVLRSLK